MPQYVIPPERVYWWSYLIDFESALAMQAIFDHLNQMNQRRAVLLALGGAVAAAGEVSVRTPLRPLSLSPLADRQRQQWSPLMSSGVIAGVAEIRP